MPRRHHDPNTGTDLSDKIAAELRAKYGYAEPPVEGRRPRKVKDAQGREYRSISEGIRKHRIGMGRFYKYRDLHGLTSEEAFYQLTEKEMNGKEKTDNQRSSRQGVSERVADGPRMGQDADARTEQALHRMERGTGADGAEGRPEGNGIEGAQRVLSASEINNPSYYDACNITVTYRPIDLEKWYPAFIFSAMKYLFRFNLKQGDRDLMKAIRYLLWWMQDDKVREAAVNQKPPRSQAMLIAAYRERYDWMRMLINSEGAPHFCAKVIGWACDHIKGPIPQELKDEILATCVCEGVLTFEEFLDECRR